MSVYACQSTTRTAGPRPGRTTSSPARRTRCLQGQAGRRAPSPPPRAEGAPAVRPGGPSAAVDRPLRPAEAADRGPGDRGPQHEGEDDLFEEGEVARHGPALPDRPPPRPDSGPRAGPRSASIQTRGPTARVPLRDLPRGRARTWRRQDRPGQAPKGRPMFRRPCRFTLDADEVLRIHEGEPPYFISSDPIVLKKEPGVVFRSDLKAGGPEAGPGRKFLPRGG